MFPVRRSRQELRKEFGLGDSSRYPNAHTLAASAQAPGNAEAPAPVPLQDWTKTHPTTAKRVYLNNVAPIIMLWIIARSVVQPHSAMTPAQKTGRNRVDAFFTTTLQKAWVDLFPDARNEFGVVKEKIKRLVDTSKYDPTKYITYIQNLPDDQKAKYAGKIAQFFTTLNKIINNTLLGGGTVLAAFNADTNTKKMMLDVSIRRDAYKAAVYSLITQREKVSLKIISSLLKLGTPLTILFLTGFLLYSILQLLAQFTQRSDIPNDNDSNPLWMAGTTLLSLILLVPIFNRFTADKERHLKKSSLASITVFPDLLKEIHALAENKDTLNIKCNPQTRVPATYTYSYEQVTKTVNLRSEYPHEKPAEDAGESSSKSTVQSDKVEYKLSKYYNSEKNKWIPIQIDEDVRHFVGGLFMMNAVKKEDAYRPALLETLFYGHALPKDDTTGTNGIKFFDSDKKGPIAYVKNGDGRGICRAFRAQYQIIVGDKIKEEEGLVYILLVTGPKPDIAKIVKAALNQPIPDESPHI